MTTPDDMPATLYPPGQRLAAADRHDWWHSTGRVAVVKRDADRWIAQCPVCSSWEHHTIDDKGRPFTFIVGRLSYFGGLLAGELRCSMCYGVSSVEWPPKAMRRRIVEVTRRRPNPITRSWNPGQSITDLEAENVAHGVATVRGR